MCILDIEMEVCIIHSVKSTDGSPHNLFCASLGCPEVKGTDFNALLFLVRRHRSSHYHEDLVAAIQRRGWLAQEIK
jgi:hypothetical protein